MKIRIIREHWYNLHAFKVKSSNSIDYTASQFHLSDNCVFAGGKLDRDDRFSRLVEFNALNVKREGGREGDEHCGFPEHTLTVAHEYFRTAVCVITRHRCVITRLKDWEQRSYYREVCKILSPPSPSFVFFFHSL